MREFFASGAFYFYSERQPHLVPRHTAVRRTRHAFIYEAEFRVIRQQALLAGQNKTPSSLLPCILYRALQKHPRAAALSVRWNCIDAKNHLPRTILVV